jgi:LPS-assembly lipoprotein
MQRRTLLAAAPLPILAACGFQLRQAPNFVFQTIYIATGESSPLGNELKRSIASNGNVKLIDAAQITQAQVILDVIQELRQKIVVGFTATGQVREFQLRSRFTFRLRTQSGKELIPATEILQQRDISFNESAVLSKESEEALLYRDMQSDIVQQLMRRLAAVKEL